MKKNPAALTASFDTLRKLAESPKPGHQVPPLDTTAGALPRIVEDAAPTGAPTAAAQRHETAAATSPSEAAASVPAAVDGYMVYDPDYEYKVGDRVLLPLELFGHNPRNPRVFTSDKEMQSLVESLAANGQLETAYVYPKGADGKFKGKGGHRRNIGLQTLNKSVMKVEIVAPAQNELEAFKQARAMNSEHAKPSYIDEALRYAELLKDGIAPDQATLALAMNISTGDLSKMLSVAEMPALILEEMAENITNFGLSSGYAIFRFWKRMDFDEERTLLLVRKVIDGKLSVRALEDVVRDAAPNGRPAGKRQHALARAVVSGPGKGELKCYADGKVNFQVGELEPGRRDEIYAKVVAVLREAGFDVQSGVAAEA